MRRALENLRKQYQWRDISDDEYRRERGIIMRLVIERITVENGVARIDAVIPPDQDNLRNRYPEPVEGCASVNPEPPAPSFQQKLKSTAPLIPPGSSLPRNTYEQP